MTSPIKELSIAYFYILHFERTGVNYFAILYYSYGYLRYYD